MGRSPHHQTPEVTPTAGRSKVHPGHTNVSAGSWARGGCCGPGRPARDLAAVPHDGWIHRDIKPSNILLLDGRWTLADWGIVRRPSGQTTKVGRPRLSIGTPEFAAPELSEACTVPRSPATTTASAE
ncbi:hypothetical protein [Streptomyces sp. NPDC059909]|uniref:protein kinase domain-containing protein n=1 Tax=Streptomyces sp. NPDC059909 TaxID=3346998 RepID=UPI003661BAB3